MFRCALLSASGARFRTTPEEPSPSKSHLLAQQPHRTPDANCREERTNLMRDKFGLVIPTLNEEANIGAVLDRVRANLDDSKLDIDYELLVVDDDSSDGTSAVVNQYSKSDPRVRLLVRKGRKGLAGAVIYGWDR